MFYCRLKSSAAQWCLFNNQHCTRCCIVPRIRFRVKLTAIKISLSLLFAYFLIMLLKLKQQKFTKFKQQISMCVHVYPLLNKVQPLVDSWYRYCKEFLLRDKSAGLMSKDLDLFPCINFPVKPEKNSPVWQCSLSTKVSSIVLKADINIRRNLLTKFKRTYVCVFLWLL